jgi:hypothetical protein
MPLIRTTWLALCLVLPGATHASDWQYAGYAKDGNDEIYLFYDAESVQRPNENTVRYWLKAMTKANLELYFTKHQNLLIEKTVQKVAKGYVPRYLQLNTVRSHYDDDESLEAITMEASSFELIANKRDALVKHKIYYELDCIERKLRILEAISFDSHGDISKQIGASEASYQFVSPDSNGDAQSQLICSKN